ncbi:MAG: hypothetical protein WC877_00630 [Dehalococcoidales bacterium]|jgi:hypothetical protein
MSDTSTETKVRKCGYCRKILDDGNPNNYCDENHEMLRRNSNKTYYKNHKSDCVKRNKQWKKDHPDEVSTYNHDYYVKHNLKEKEKDRLPYKRKWRKNHDKT